MSDWTNRYWPRSGERGSASNSSNSRRTSPRSRASRSPSSRPLTAASPASVKVCPRTEASWTRPRSTGSSVSSREVMSERSVSGTARSPSSPTGRYAPLTRSSRPSAASARTVSTAYSGIPSARPRIASTAGPGRPGTRPSRSPRIEGSDRGSSATAKKFRCPAPQSGRLSNSSGRASVTTRIGAPLDHSSRWSMKSSRPLSAH